MDAVHRAAYARDPDVIALCLAKSARQFVFDDPARIYPGVRCERRDFYAARAIDRQAAPSLVCDSSAREICFSRRRADDDGGRLCRTREYFEVRLILTLSRRDVSCIILLELSLLYN